MQDLLGARPRICSKRPTRSESRLHSPWVKNARRLPILRGLLALVVLFGVASLPLSGQSPSTALPPAESGAPHGWQVFENCPVLTEHLVDVPALESGILRSLEVELNAMVAEGVVIANLDTDLAEMDLRLAELQRDAANKLATDNSDVEYHQLALQEVEEELENFRSIGSSVSDSEIRRLKLSVGKARLALVRARQAQTRAVLEAQLKAATVEAAEQRLQRRVIAAPLSGVVSAISRHPGQWVEAGQTIAQIRYLDHLVVDRLIPLQQVNLTSIIGAEVRVDVPGHAGQTTRLAGQVTSYDHEVSSQGYVRVHARIANVQKDGQWALLPGMNVNMYLGSRHLKTPPATGKSAARTSLPIGNDAR